MEEVPSTIAEIYTYANGTTQDDATVGDILKDLKAMKQAAPDSMSAESTIGANLLQSAWTTEAVRNDFLDGGLICEPSGKPFNVQLVHYELRRLLWSTKTR